ncbi:MAG: recombinase zinc ribbon domain-containing protein [Acidimicrobiales bacterium]
MPTPTGGSGHHKSLHRHQINAEQAPWRAFPTIAPTSAPSQPFALHGLVVCALCQRKMQGSANHGRAHYRCCYPSEYAMANELDHPRNVYVREDQITCRRTDLQLCSTPPCDGKSLVKLRRAA